MKSFAEYMLGQLDIQLPAGICKYTKYIFHLSSRVVAGKIKEKKSMVEVKMSFFPGTEIDFHPQAHVFLTSASVPTGEKSTKN